MPKPNYHKRAIESAVRKYLISRPVGYIVSSPNILYDLKLDTEEMMNDVYVSKAVFNVKDEKVLEKHGKFLNELDWDKKFSRNGKRATKVYMIEEYIND